MKVRLEPLATQRLDDFDCRNDELSSWLIRHAHTATGHGTRTTVLVDAADRVVGYFSIAPHLVESDDLPSKVGRGSPRQIPAILLAKLAIARNAHGHGLGSEALVSVLRIVVTLAREVGGKVVVVDAITKRPRHSTSTTISFG